MIIISIPALMIQTYGNKSRGDLRPADWPTLPPEPKRQAAAFHLKLPSLPHIVLRAVLYMYSPFVAAFHCMFAGELQYPLSILSVHCAVL